MAADGSTDGAGWFPGEESNERMPGARQRMVNSAERMLARRGYQATSFSSVLAESAAPRGSVYHHFPGGKDQLVLAALEQSGKNILAVLEASSGKSAITVTTQFLAAWRSLLENYECDGGCVVTAVTVSAESEKLKDVAANIFSNSLAVLESVLTTGGIRKAEARSFAYLLVSAVEGAVILSRSQHSLEPFDVVAAQMRSESRRLISNRRTDLARRLRNQANP